MVDLLAQWDWWYWQSSWDLLEAWRWLNLLSKGSVIVLLVMIGQVGLTILLAAAKHISVRWESRQFVLAMKEARRNSCFEAVIATALKFKTTHVGAVVAAGLASFRELPPSLSKEEAREWVQRAMKRVFVLKAAEMRAGLHTLTTIADTATLVGMFGALWAILNSFRGGSGSPWSWLMYYLGNLYIATSFLAIGMFASVLAFWAHGLLTRASNRLVRDVDSAALEIVECVWRHPEWRQDDETNSSLELILAFHSRGYPWEVTYDHQRALFAAVCLGELYFFYLVMGGVWYSMSTDVGYAIVLGICLLVAGVIGLSIRLTRNRGTSAAPQDASVAERFYHQSIDRRRRARLPLRQRLAVLPDRSLVFGMPLLTCLMFMLFINQSHRMPKGIDVAIAPRETAPLSKMSDRAIFVQVQKAHKTGPYMQPPLLRVQRKLVTESDLRQHLQQELARHDDRSVFIYGDKELPYQSVVNVVDLVNQLGGRPVLVGSTASSRIP